MTYGKDGLYDAAYTYGLERIEVEDLDETRPESQDPLYYLYDGLGSVAYMVKPDGNVRDHYRYDEFGKPAPGYSKQSPDGAINLNNTFGYTGEMWDEESGLLYLRARYYEPETGRFLSRDTYAGNAIDPLSLNRYAYVGNNPINFVDPSGYLQVRIGNTYLQARIDSTSGRIKINAERLANALHFGVSHKTNGNYVVWMPNGKGWEYTAREHAMFDLLSQWGIQWNASNWEKLKLVGNGLSEKWGYRHYDTRATYVATFSQAGLLTPEEAGMVFDLMEGYATGELIAGGVGIAKISIKGTSNALNIPSNIDNAGKFVNWTRQFEKTKTPLTTAQVDELIAQAKKFGVKVEASASDLAGHIGKAGENWGIPHIHIGDARVHIPVPKGYKLK